MNWTRRISMVATTVAITTAMIVGPVSASPMPPEFGSAVKCKYAVTQSTGGLWTEAELRMIAVIPPVMYATEVGNEVGWRFVVIRYAENRFKNVAKSAIQKRVPYNTDSADFDVMRYRVSLPTVAHPESVRYFVRLVMFHYNADGSLHSQVSQLLETHIATFDGVRDDQGFDFCEGTASQSI